MKLLFDLNKQCFTWNHWQHNTTTLLAFGPHSGWCVAFLQPNTRRKMVNQQPEVFYGCNWGRNMKFKIIKSTIESFYFIILHMAEIEGDLVFWTFVFKKHLCAWYSWSAPKVIYSHESGRVQIPKEMVRELVAPREAGHQARGTNSGLFSQMDLLIMRNRPNWFNQSGQKLG